MPKVFCIYRDCADAIGAAWAVHKALGSEVEFVKTKLGDPMPNSICERHRYEPDEQGEAICVECGAQADEEWTNCIGRDVLILGHLYPLEVLRAMAQEARSVLVIGDELRGIAPPYEWSRWIKVVGNEVKDYLKMARLFDPSRSTAGLTWDYLHSSKQPHCDCGDSGICKMECPRYEQKMRAQPPRPHPINLIEDWSLGRCKYGDETRAFHAVLASYDWTNLPEMFKRLDRRHPSH